MLVILLFVALILVSLGMGMLLAIRHYYDKMEYHHLTPDEIVILLILGAGIDLVLIFNIGINTA